MIDCAYFWQRHSVFDARMRENCLGSYVPSPRNTGPLDSLAPPLLPKKKVPKVDPH